MGKTKLIGFKVTDDEFEQIKYKARSLGLDVSKFLILLWYRFGKDYR